MPKSVVVHFALQTAPGMSRHRIGVWNTDGGVLCSPSAQIPDPVEFDEGTTFILEASVPREPRPNKPRTRDERRWRLRAAPNSSTVLELGGTRGSGHRGFPGIEVRVDGATQIS
jgi:hypothetical protein